MPILTPKKPKLFFEVTPSHILGMFIFFHSLFFFNWLNFRLAIANTAIILDFCFRGGQWNSGGQCHKETEPIFNKSFLSHYPSKNRALEQVLRHMKTPVIYLNISRLTDYRKDAHPSIYRKRYNSLEEQIAAEKSQDCSHWCLPGVPDIWNQMLYASMLLTGKGSWRN
jgi:GDSL/SGNH-like Acyl-Esterase family found in Pmr5 and Cas1p